jgi:UDP-GlcNAc3NAcA epimerase
MVSKAFLEAGAIEEVVVHTGQHFDKEMSDVFFEELNLPRPVYNLGIRGGTHAGMTGRMLIKIEEVLFQEKPDLVLVYGDTNSTLAGVLSAVKIHIPVAHVEAGLRSYDPRMPEEINRVMSDAVSDLLFCPTKQAVENLRKENVYTGNLNEQKVFLVGDVMYDSYLLLSNFRKENIKQELNLNDDNYILATVHRAENTDIKENLERVIALLEETAKITKLPVILPLHPRTRTKIKEFNISINHDVVCIKPVSYLEMLTLLNSCYLVLTDSGGLQKEAFWAQKICLTLRDNTEWTETVDAGYNFLVGREQEKLYDALKRIESISFDTAAYKKICIEYGKGEASKRIAEVLKNNL